MNKDKLIDLLVNYPKLWNELMSTDDVDSFVSKHRAELRAIKGYADIEGNTKSPFESVADAFDTYSNLPDNYLTDMASKLGLSKEEVQKQLDYINSLGVSYADKKKLADDFVNRANAVNTYEHSYLGMDTDNPVNKGLNWLADKIISPTTKQQIVEQNYDAAVGSGLADVARTGSNFLPGVGGIVTSPIIGTVRDAALSDKSVGDLAWEGSKELVANTALSKGLGGLIGSIPGIASNYNFVSKIANNFKPYQWENIANLAGKKLGKNVQVPKFNSNSEALEWIAKQPADVQNSLISVLRDIPDNVTTALRGKEGQLFAENFKDARLGKIAEDWAKEHPVKAGVGKATGDITRGVEKDLVIDRENGEKTETKPKSNSYDDTLDAIISTYKRQWDAGFVPRSGIELEAYNKYMGLNDTNSDLDYLTKKKSFTDWYNGVR